MEKTYCPTNGTFQTSGLVNCISFNTHETSDRKKGERKKRWKKDRKEKRGEKEKRKGFKG